MKRKKRRPSPLLAAKAPPQTIKKDYGQDHAARLRACVWSISLAFVYGMFNDLILGRPETKVSTEAIAVCIGTLVIQFVLFHTRPTFVSSGIQFAGHLWSTFQGLKHRKIGRLAAAVTVAFVVFAVPIGKVTPSIEAAALRTSNAGLVPGMDTGLVGSRPSVRFREVSNRIETAIREKKPGNPDSIRETRESLARIVENVRLPENVLTNAQLELALLQSYESLSRIGAEDPQLLRQSGSGVVPGVSTVFGAGIDKTKFIATPELKYFTETSSQPRFFSDFTVWSPGRNPGSPPPQFAVTHGDNTAVVFNNVKIVGFAQDIGNLTWTNVIFENCLISYRGEPIRMANVRFYNCEFERSPDGRGQELLEYISSHQGESVNAYVH